MIYGTNFGASPIPEGIRKKFPKGHPTNKRAYLAGVCQSEDDFRTMKIIADNGRRMLYRLDRTNYIGLYVF